MGGEEYPVRGGSGEGILPSHGALGWEKLPLLGKPVRDVCGQVSGFPELCNVLLRNGGDHPLASRSGHVWSDFVEKMRTWALELECARKDGQGRRRRG